MKRLIKGDWVILSLVFLAVFLNGCADAAPEIVPEVDSIDSIQNVIGVPETAKENAGNQGILGFDTLGTEPRIEKINTLMVSRGKLSPHNKIIRKDIEVSSAADIDSSLAAWQTSGKPLFLNCHGGVVAAKTALSRPLEDGLNAVVENANMFPYYLIYDAGLGQMFLIEFEQAWQKIKDLLSGRIFRMLMAKFKRLIYKKKYKKEVTPFSKLSYKNADAEIAELIEWGQSEGFLDVDWNDESLMLTKAEEKSFNVDVKNAVIEDFDDVILNKKILTVDNGIRRLERGKLLNFLGKINFGKVATNTIIRFASKRHHGLLLTLFEEWLHSGKISTRGKDIIPAIVRKIVEIVWDNAKADVRAGFTSGENAAGSTLVNKLVDKKGEIVLMGSSTGAIYVCEIIKKMKAIKAVNPNAFKDLKIKVILVVAACRFTLFKQTFEHTSHLFKSEDVLVLSLSDEKEMKGFGPGIPIGSTLYLVSGVAEKMDFTHDVPILGMERFFIKKDVLKLLSSEDSAAIEFAYDYLDYGKSNTKIVVSNTPHPTAPYLKHSGTRHVNLVKDSDALKSIALFSLYGYNFVE